MSYEIKLNAVCVINVTKKMQTREDVWERTKTANDEFNCVLNRV